MYPVDKIRVTPLGADFSTAASTYLLGKTRYMGGDFSILCGVRGSTVTSTGQSATVAANWDFSVMESTAATAAASVISGATMTLGAATALTLRGAVSVICKVASNLATTAGLTINGVNYKATAAGATAANGAKLLAKYINGELGSKKLPHYMAIADYSSANLMAIIPDDDLGTGLTVEATSGGPQIFVGDLQGVITVNAGKLSTNYPKFIGVGCTQLTGTDTAIRYALLVKEPSGGPATPGVRVNCTT